VVTPLNWAIKAEELDYCLRDGYSRALAIAPVQRGTAIFSAATAPATAAAATSSNTMALASKQQVVPALQAP
jgi:hypothetical protein